MLKFNLVIASFALLLTTSFAQSNPALQLAGYWKMYNSAWDVDNKNYVRIIPKEDGQFDANYLNNDELVELKGVVLGEKQLSINEFSSNTSKNIYNGQIAINGTIEGYYASKTETLGRFTWIKICDDTGKPLNSYDLPCRVANAAYVPVSYETQTKIPTESANTSTKKVIQMKEVVEYVGEARNPNLPLAQTVTELPTNAIVVGHIGLDSIITFKTVEMDVPVEASVTSKKIVTKAQNTTQSSKIKENAKSAYTNKKVISESTKTKQDAIASANTEKINEILTARGVEAIPAAYDFQDNTNNLNIAPISTKFGTCDPGNIDAAKVIVKMERGLTVEENGHVYHIVGKGETMTAISRLYNIPIMELAENNKKECERINIGEKLLIK